MCVCQDIRILGVKDWRSVALNGEEWRIILRKARARKGLSCQEVSNRFAALEDLDTEEEINTVWEKMREYQTFSQRGSRLL
jgi:hypothetical protein